MTKTATPNGTKIDAPVHASLAEALVAAQAEMPAVEPDSVNPHFKSRFVSLGNLVAKTRPVLNRHGIAVTQFPSIDENGKPTLVTILLHGPTGERLEYPAPLMLTKADPQGQGSAITYMRRYAWSSSLGIVDQEDDDGNSASAQANGAAKTEPAAQPQAPSGPRKLNTGERLRITEAFAKAGVDVDNGGMDMYLAAVGADSIEDVDVEQAKALKGHLDGLATKAGA